MANQKKLVAFVVYEGMSLLELDASYGFLRGITMGPWQLTTVGASRDAVRTDTRLAVVPHHTFTEIERVDGLVIPGAGGATPLLALGNDELIAFVRSAGGRAAWCASFGTGSLLLAAAGLLVGRRATTHWAYETLLPPLGAVLSRERIVEDGTYLTASGGSGAIDATLRLLDRIAGRRRARLVQLFGEYDPAPPFGAIDPAYRDRRYVAEALEAAHPALAPTFERYPALSEAVSKIIAAELRNPPEVAA